MKKALPAVLFLLFLTLLVACDTPISTTPLTTSNTSYVVFADPTLEAIVCGAMGKTKVGITVAEAKTVTYLDLSYGEWQRFISDKEPIRSIGGLENFTNLESLKLSGNVINDILPLSTLTNLKALILSGCVAEDYTPLAELTNLRVLILDHSTIADPTPLLALTNLKCLYLKDSRIRSFLPLADIRLGLELADFDVAFNLSELGFSFNDNDKLALYQTEEYDIRINHLEWGEPSRSDWGNCIVVVTVTDTGYKNAIGFYPEHNAYVAWLFNINTEENYTYVYELGKPNNISDRVHLETIVREAFIDVNEDDVLFTPFLFFDNKIQEALGIPVEILCNMPFDDTIPLQSPYEKLGFEFVDYRGVYTYKEGCLELSIHKPQWDDHVDAENRLDWNMSYLNTEVKGYNLFVLYFEKEDVYYYSLEKDDTKIGFNYYPVTNKFDYDPQSIEPLRTSLNEILNTQGKNFMEILITIFKDSLQDRFGMSVDKLYALFR